MYVSHDYKCPGCGHVEADVFIKRSEMHEYACPQCGDTMTILPCAPRVDWTQLAMGKNASPEAIKRFERSRKQQKEREERSMREHGDRGKAPGA